MATKVIVYGRAADPSFANVQSRLTAAAIPFTAVDADNERVTDITRNPLKWEIDDIKVLLREIYAKIQTL